MAELRTNAPTTVTTDQVRSLLREIDIEASDAIVAAATTALAVQAYTGRTVPVGHHGTELIALTDDERDILVHHSATAEASIRRVASAVEVVVKAAEDLPSATISTFDPILGQISRYKCLRLMMQGADVSDDEATALHAEAIQPFSQDTPPVVRSMAGAAEAVRLVLSFNDIDVVDANLLRGALTFLDQRTT